LRPPASGAGVNWTSQRWGAELARRLPEGLQGVNAPWPDL
jgi:hypothetical protein